MCVTKFHNILLSKNRKGWLWEIYMQLHFHYSYNVLHKRKTFGLYLVKIIYYILCILSNYLVIFMPCFVIREYFSEGLPLHVSNPSLFRCFPFGFYLLRFTLLWFLEFFSVIFHPWHLQFKLVYVILKM